MYYLGKTLELMGIACLGAALYLGCVNPFDYSESKAMGVEMGFLTLGVLIFLSVDSLRNVSETNS